MKKLFAVLLAVAMLLSLGVTAFADGTGRIVILDPPAGTDGDSYKAYKIFDAVVGDDNKVVYYASSDWAGTLFNIDDVTSAATTLDDPALYGLKFVLDATNNDRYQVVKSTGFDAERFATYMSDYVADEEAFSLDTDTGDIYADVAPGYYLVKSTEPASLALTNVLEGKTVKVQNKKDMPLEKDVEVDGDDDYTDNNTGVSVGDELKYKITTKVPTDISEDADTYTFVISDTMTDGLTFGDKLTITIGAVVYEIVYHPATGHTTADQAYIEVTQSGTAGNADVAAQIAALVAEIATLETQIDAKQAAIDADTPTVTAAQGDVTTAQAALTAAQTKLAAMEAAMIANDYDPAVEIDGKTYTSAAELLADLGTADPATGQYEAVKNAQAALTAAQGALTTAQNSHQTLVDEKADLEAQKTAKQAQITALQNAVNGENVETFTLVDNATDLLSGDQVRFYENGKTFELSIDMKSRSAQAGTPVTIEYTATVNENAVAEILQNAAVLAFGNDSDIDYRDAETDNYTSQLIIDKFETGNRSQKLAGAEFVLKATDGENVGKYYKLSGKPVEADIGSEDGLKHDATFPEKLEYGDRVDIPVVVFVADENGKLQVAVLEDGAPDQNGNYNPATSTGTGGYASTLFYSDVKVEWVDEGAASKVVTDAEGRGVFGYLPDGSYELIETVAPVDYIKLTDPIEITIDGHRAVDKSLEKAERIAALTNAANVENTPGSSLPSTGGTGATLMTIGGVALILAAGAFLVLRRRKEQE